MTIGSIGKELSHPQGHRFNSFYQCEDLFGGDMLALKGLL